MKIGVIIAMDIEYRQMHAAIGGDTGRLGDNDIVLWQCGIGKVNAAIGTMRLVAAHHPDAIISTGLAGGIDPLIQVLDVLAATQCVYHDVDCGIGLGCSLGQVQGLPARFDADSHLLNHALQTAKRFSLPPQPADRADASASESRSPSRTTPGPESSNNS